MPSHLPDLQEPAGLEARLSTLLDERASVWPTRPEPLFGKLQRALRAYSEYVVNVAQATPFPELPPALVRACSSFQETPCVIVGHPKSGTTLMNNLVEGHPGLFVLPFEGRFWTKKRRWRHLGYEERIERLCHTWLHRLINPNGQGPFWLLGTPDEPGSNPYVDFIRYFNLWERHLGKKDRGRLILALVHALYSVNPTPVPPVRWVEKTPGAEFFVRDILACFPKARFIHVVRDPRAVIAARKTTHTSKKLPDPYPILHDAVLLRYSLAAARRYASRLGKDRYLIVRFERLVQDTEAVMHEVARFLEVDMDPSLLTPTVFGITPPSNSAYKPLRRKGGVYDDSVARYRTILNEDEANLVSMLLRRPAAQVGYELPSPDRLAATTTVLRTLPSSLMMLAGLGYGRIRARWKGRPPG